MRMRMRFFDVYTTQDGTVRRKDTDNRAKKSANLSSRTASATIELFSATLTFTSDAQLSW